MGGAGVDPNPSRFTRSSWSTFMFITLNSIRRFRRRFASLVLGTSGSVSP